MAESRLPQMKRYMATMIEIRLDPYTNAWMSLFIERTFYVAILSMAQLVEPMVSWQAPNRGSPPSPQLSLCVNSLPMSLLRSLGIRGCILGPLEVPHCGLGGRFRLCIGLLPRAEVVSVLIVRSTAVGLHYWWAVQAKYLLRLWTAHMNSQSLLQLSSPRRKNWRKPTFPGHPFSMAKVGSTVHIRLL